MSLVLNPVLGVGWHRYLPQVESAACTIDAEGLSGQTRLSWFRFCPGADCIFNMGGTAKHFRPMMDESVFLVPKNGAIGPPRERAKPTIQAEFDVRGEASRHWQSLRPSETAEIKRPNRPKRPKRQPLSGCRNTSCEQWRSSWMRSRVRRVAYSGVAYSRVEWSREETGSSHRYPELRRITP